MMIATCQNCGRQWPQTNLNQIKDIFQRVDAGEPMPAGECPACDALCHCEQGERFAVAHRQHEHGSLGLFFFSSKEKALRYAARIVGDELSIWGEGVELIAEAISEGRYEKSVELWHQLPGNNDSIDVESIEIDLFDSDDEIVTPDHVSSGELD